MTYILPNEVGVIRFKMNKGEVKDLQIENDRLFNHRVLYKTTDCKTLMMLDEELARSIVPFEMDAIEISKDFDCEIVCVFRDFGMRLCFPRGYNNGYDYEDESILYCDDIIEVKGGMKEHINLINNDISKIYNHLGHCFNFNTKTRKATWTEYNPVTFKLADIDDNGKPFNIQSSDTRFNI